MLIGWEGPPPRHARRQGGGFILVLLLFCYCFLPSTLLTIIPFYASLSITVEKMQIIIYYIYMFIYVLYQ